MKPPTPTPSKDAKETTPLLGLHSREESKSSVASKRSSSSNLGVPTGSPHRHSAPPSPRTSTPAPKDDERGRPVSRTAKSSTPQLSPDHLPQPRPSSPHSIPSKPSTPGPRLRPSQVANPRSVSGLKRRTTPRKKKGFWICHEDFLMSTDEDADVWLNRRDKAGLIMACITLSLLIFSDFVVFYIVSVGEWAEIHAVLYSFLVILAVVSHLQVMFSDPGTVPRNAQPLSRGDPSQPETICGRCDAYKPTRAHHCRICGRCIVRMDHHCPWMNNCVGWANQKHFCLFLFYTCIVSLYMLILIAYTLIADIQINNASYVMIYIMIFLSFAAFLFTMSMILSQSHGILTGEGTVDRLQRRRKDKARISHNYRPEDFKPVCMKDVFGKYICLWLIPVGPHFEDPNRVRGFRNPDEDLEKGKYASLGNTQPVDFPKSSEPTVAEYSDGASNVTAHSRGANTVRETSSSALRGGGGAAEEEESKVESPTATPRFYDSEVSTPKEEKEYV